jgi:hypothetical protein
MLAPQWFYLRVGPYLRRERDKRRYHRLFSSEGYVQGVMRWAYLGLARRISVATFETADLRYPAVVEFRNAVANNTRFFADLFDRHAELRAELWRITRPEHRPAIAPAPFLGIHVRRGDFLLSRDPEQLRGQSNVRLPLSWYVEMLRELRSAIGDCTPAKVFSDGERGELQELLREPNTELVPMRSAVHDMLLLSQAAVIVASGSGFSMWAAFLGQAPRLCFPGQRRERVVSEHQVELEPECACGSDMPEGFAAAARARCLRGNETDKGKTCQESAPFAC